jgi:hypothetical protein
MNPDGYSPRDVCIAEVYVPDCVATVQCSWSFAMNNFCNADCCFPTFVTMPNEDA